MNKLFNRHYFLMISIDYTSFEHHFYHITLMRKLCGFEDKVNFRQSDSLLPVNLVLHLSNIFLVNSISEWIIMYTRKAKEVIINKIQANTTLEPILIYTTVVTLKNERYWQYCKYYTILKVVQTKRSFKG